MTLTQTYEHTCVSFMAPEEEKRITKGITRGKKKKCLNILSVSGWKCGFFNELCSFVNVKWSGLISFYDLMRFCLVILVVFVVFWKLWFYKCFLGRKFREKSVRVFFFVFFFFFFFFNAILCSGIINFCAVLRLKIYFFLL